MFTLTIVKLKALTNWNGLTEKSMVIFGKKML
jgi:hypothetical protein